MLAAWALKNFTGKKGTGFAKLCRFTRSIELLVCFATAFCSSARGFSKLVHVLCFLSSFLWFLNLLTNFLRVLSAFESLNTCSASECLQIRILCSQRYCNSWFCFFAGLFPVECLLQHGIWLSGLLPIDFMHFLPQCGNCGMDFGHQMTYLVSVFAI